MLLAYTAIFKIKPRGSLNRSTVVGGISIGGTDSPVRSTS